MNRLVSSMSKVDIEEFDENSSEHLSEMDVECSEGLESDLRNDKDDEDDPEGDNGYENDSEDDDGNEDDSEGDDNNEDDIEGDEDDRDSSGSDDSGSGDDEYDNRTALQRSLIYKCSWMINFCPPPVRKYQKSRKCLAYCHHLLLKHLKDSFVIKYSISSFDTLISMEDRNMQK